MKIRNNIKSTVFQSIALVCIVLGAASCESKSNKEEAKEIHNEAIIDENKKEKDAAFLSKAAEINIEEIALGQLAMEKGTMKAVSELGKMMDVDHTKCLKGLSELAKEKNIVIPAGLTPDAEEAYKKLEHKNGIHFDEEYCDMMVKGHENAITMFDKAATECSDPDIRDWATKTLPSLKAHLHHAMMCKAKCGKNK
jgi:putative membrane protein